MSYAAQADLALDQAFRNRAAAAAAHEGIVQADKWAADNAWTLSAAPGFADSYAYAQLTENPAPGRDDAVITDSQIFAAVLAVLRPAG